MYVDVFQWICIWPSISPSFPHPRIQQTAVGKQYFRSVDGSPWMWRAHYVQCSTPFYVRDLAIRGFWYLLGFWNQSPADPEGWLGSQKSYVDFGLCRGPAPQARAVQGRTVHPLYDSGHSLDPTVHPLHIPASFFLNYIQWWRWTESTPKKGTDAVPIKLYFITFMTLALSSNLGLLITLPHLR